MNAKMFFKISIFFFLLMFNIGYGLAQSTSKPLSTNFVLVNLSPNQANASISYYKVDGSVWKTPDTITIAGNGGQAIFRQYSDASLPSGNGSVVVSSDQPLASLVQEIVNPSSGQVPSSGAYKGILTGSSKYYLPQVARNGSSATGIANSVIVIQNLGSSPVNVDVKFIPYGSSTVSFTKNLTNIQPNASYYYDINLETSLANGFYSASVEVSGSGTIGVVTNLFFGQHSLMAYNGFPMEALTSKWQVPLVYSRLANSLVTSIVVQNLDTSPIPVNDLSLNCSKDATSPGPSSITTNNESQIPVNGVYFWNTLIQTAQFPEGWYGACTVQSALNRGFVTLVQYRYTANSEQAAYEAISGSSTDTKAFIPLIAKRLANNFATAVTIQNLSGSNITVNITYTRSPEAGSIGNPTYTETGVVIPANSSIIRNMRLADVAGLGIPDGWYGTMTITGSGPIGAYVANTYLGSPNGDRFMAYTAFTQP